MELANFAKLCDTDGEICESAIADYRLKMISVEPGDNLKGRIGNPFCGRYKCQSFTRIAIGIPVRTLEAAEKTPNMVRHPDRIFCTLA